MVKRFRPSWGVAAIGILVGGILSACGSDTPPAPVGRDLDPGAFLADYTAGVCASARTCVGEAGEPALAGCGFAVAFGDDAGCTTWMNQRSVGIAGALAAGDLCFFGPPREFEGTTPASRCLEELAAAQPSCLSGADAVTDCEGVGEAGEATGEGIENALSLPLSCRCVFLPLGEIPAGCQGVLAATDLGATLDDPTTCGGG